MNEVLVAPGGAAIAGEPHVRTAAVDPLDPTAVVGAGPGARGGAGRRRTRGAARRGRRRRAACGGDRRVRAGPRGGAARDVEGVLPRGRRGRGRPDGARPGVPRRRDGRGRRLHPRAGRRRGGRGAQGRRAGRGQGRDRDRVARAGARPPAVLPRRAARGPSRRSSSRSGSSGREASVIAICDGTRAMALPAARDHKRLCDDDQGPNTGGMGAYSPLPDLDDAAGRARARRRSTGRSWPRWPAAGRRSAASSTRASCSRPTARRCSSATSASATPRRRSSCRGSPDPSGRCCSPPPTAGCPDDAPARLPELPGAAVGIVLAAKGYPGDPRRGDPISGIDAAAAQGALVFHAGTVGRPQGGFGTNGGRVLTVVGRGPTLRDRARRRRASGRRDRLGRAAAPARHRRATCRCPPGCPHDPALHAARDGRRVVRAGPLRADARGRARRVPRPGPPRPGPGGRARGHRGEGTRRRRSGSPRSRRPPTTTSSPSSARSPRPSGRRAATSTWA